MSTLHYEYDNKLEELLMKNGMEERIRNIIKNVMKRARGRLSADIAGHLRNDPRQAYKAVKHSVYKRVLGGNLSILNKRRAGSPRAYTPTRTLRQGQVGGNRRPRSKRTETVDGYYGSDRGFILRFVNSGTAERETEYGRRGAIAPRHFFYQEGQKEMEQAMEELAQLINEEIEKA